MELFEVMCNASDVAFWVVVGKKHNKIFHLVHYESKALNNTHNNCTTTKKELLVVMCTFEKLREYIW